MPNQEDKRRLLALLYDAKEALPGEKAAAWTAYHAEVDKVRAGTTFSRGEVTEFLHQTGYREYAKLRRMSELG